MTTYVDTPADLVGLVGQRLGTTDWNDVSQREVDLFADAIDYHRSRTTDSAPAEGAFTATVAQNYFTLSLTPMVISEVLKIGNRQAALNYGLNRVRFLAPARVGSRVRATVSAKSAEQKGIGLLLTFGISFENEGEREPACVADVIALFP
jgi:acyl dehydratase